MVSVLLEDEKVFGIFHRSKSVELDLTEDEAKYLIDKAKELYRRVSSEEFKSYEKAAETVIEYCLENLI